MNKNTIATILVGLGSAAIGTTAGYILGRRSKCKGCHKAEWYDRADKAVEEGELAKEEGYFVKFKDIDSRPSFSKYPYNEYVESMKQYELETDRYNGEEYMQGEYIRRNGQMRIRKLENNEEVWYLINDEGDEFMDEKPHEISSLSFMNDRLDEAKETLEYYAEDKVLCEAHDEVIENPEDIVGHEFDKLFDGVLSEDENVVYIHNPRLHVDYEIIKIDSSYEKDVLGATDEEVAAAKAYFGIPEEEEE